MSAAGDALAIQLEQFGGLVTHRPRSASAPPFDVLGIFSQGAMTPLRDTREGRTNTNSGSLLISDTDTDGLEVAVDDQGEFVVSGVRWAVTNVSGIDGGFAVSVEQVDRKTMRRVTGNG